MKIFITLSMLFFAFSFNELEAAKILVDQTSSQYTTINSAINAATSGDTIIVYPGTYSGFNTSVSKNLTIIGTSPLGTDGNIGTNGSTIINSNVSFSNSNYTIRLMNFYFNGAEINITADSGAVNFNVIKYATLEVNSVNSFEILDNFFENNSSNQDAIDVNNASNTTIAGNIIKTTSSSTSNEGIAIYGDNNLVTNNVIFGYYYGVFITSSSNSIVINNIIYDSYNYAIYCSVSSQTNVIANNCQYSSPGGFVISPSTQDGGGNLDDVNPDFTSIGSTYSFGSSDLTLLPGSPCIDSGNSLLTDIDGTASDMGVYGGISPFNPNFIKFLPEIVTLGVTPVIVAPGGDVTVSGSAKTIGQ